MKKFALALMASAAMVLGFGVVANATSTYPPGAPAPVVSGGGTVTPGATFTISGECAAPGTVTITFNSNTISVACEAAGTASLLGSFLTTGAANGTYSATLTAPTEPGVYPGVISGAAVGTFSVTVAAAVTPAPGGGLPATGSNSTSTMTIIAIGLFAIGAGLFGVSQMRRRTAGV